MNKPLLTKKAELGCSIAERSGDRPGIAKNNSHSRRKSSGPTRLDETHI